MICNTDLVEILLTIDNMNLVLKENIFSLKNLVEIHSGNLFKYIKKIRDALRNHIYQCEVALIVLLF